MMRVRNFGAEFTEGGGAEGAVWGGGTFEGVDSWWG